MTNTTELTSYKGPKSMCICGHTGDGDDSEHADTFSYGHGFCKVPACLCRQFTWKGWTDEFRELMLKEETHGDSA